MLNPLFRTLVKVAVASLVVGTILAHFGITADQLMNAFGLSTERLEEYARAGLRMGLAECPAWLGGDCADLVPGLFVPAARQEQQRLASYSQ